VDLRALRPRVHPREPARVDGAPPRRQSHDNNLPDGSNWELLCCYCHDNEHQKQLEAQTGLCFTARSGGWPAAQAGRDRRREIQGAIFI
jgi:hypothetical protein